MTPKYNFHYTKDQVVKATDIAKLQEMQAMVRTLMEFPVAKLEELADIEMTRSAWSHYGDDYGDNIMLKKIKILKDIICLLDECTKQDLLDELAQETAEADVAGE
jgi:hypothetical protein